MRIPAPLRLTGLALACCIVLGCQTQALTDPPPTPSPSDLGRIAARLDPAMLSALGVHADSLRFEAHRTGESVRWDARALGEEIAIGELSPGTWNVRVLLYDLDRRVRWIGEASVLVEAGRVVSVRPSLRRGDGAILPAIEPDPFAPLPELPAPTGDDGDAMETGLAYLPILGVERSERGITVRSRYACPTYATMRVVEPQFRRPEHGDAQVVVFGQDSDSWLMVRCASIEEVEQTVFLAFPPDVDVFLRDVGSAEYVLPRLCGGDGLTACLQDGPHPLARFEVEVTAGCFGIPAYYVLESDGRIVRTRDFGLQGEMRDTANLSSRDLAYARSVIETDDARHAESLGGRTPSCATEPSAFDPLDGRMVGVQSSTAPQKSVHAFYEDGVVVDLSIPATWCGAVPRVQAAADSVSKLLIGAFRTPLMGAW